MKTFEEFCRMYGYEKNDPKSKIAFGEYSKKIAEVENLALIPRNET